MTRWYFRMADAACRRRVKWLTAVGPVLIAMPVWGQQPTLDDAVTQQGQVDTDAKQAQSQINGIQDQILDERGRYAQALAEAESLEHYNDQLARQVKNQEDEIASLQRQLTEIETTTREVQPLMQQMLETLEQFVKLDVPFLIDERTERVEMLTSLMTRADVAISEKYRLIMEAYQIELEYGRTLEAYEGSLNDGRTVEFVRLGRVSLMYQTLDGSETGYWDADKKDWVVANEYASAVELAIRVARSEGAPELLTVPVPAPEEIRS